MTTSTEATNIGAGDIIDKSMMALGIQMNMKTDVNILIDILKEMKLDDFSTTYAPMALFLRKVISEQQNLKPLLQNIRQGIVEKHPAILEFAEKALHEGWFAPSKHILVSVHVAFVLEALTAAMCNSDLFFGEVVDHIRLKEREIGIDHSHLFQTIKRTWPAAINLFATAKAISLDPAMAYFRLRRQLGGAAITKERIKEMYKAGQMSYLEYKLLLPVCKKGACICSDWLRINIYEAGITEYNNGFKGNAISAHALSEDASRHCHREVFKVGNVFPEGEIDEFYESLIDDSNYFPTFAFHKDWASLYETWNMAFILGELNNLHYLFPKLLIPSVISAKSENFLGARIIALWLSINNTLFLNFNNAEKITGPENRREMALAWGEINKKYAHKLSEEQIQEDSSVLEKSYHKRFMRPFYNLSKLVFRFVF